MIDNDALIEKMAQAFLTQECAVLTNTEAYDLARVALSVVRENDKMVQAGSTGAVCDKCGGFLSNEPPIDVCGLSVKASIKDDTGVYHSTCWPTVDRTSPPSSREPDLPTSLLTRLDHQGGLTKGKRS